MQKFNHKSIFPLVNKEILIRVLVDRSVGAFFIHLVALIDGYYYTASISLPLQMEQLNLYVLHNHQYNYFPVSTAFENTRINMNIRFLGNTSFSINKREVVLFDNDDKKGLILVESTNPNLLPYFMQAQAVLAQQVLMEDKYRGLFHRYCGFVDKVRREIRVHNLQF